jgi:hypothetical protein
MSAQAYLPQYISLAGDKVGFQFSGLTYACVSVFFFLPVLWIMMCVLSACSI